METMSLTRELGTGELVERLTDAPVEELRAWIERLTDAERVARAILRQRQRRERREMAGTGG